MLSLTTLLVLEAVAGAYVSITRGLAAVMLASSGYSLRDMLMLVMTANAVCLAMCVALHEGGFGIVERRFKAKLVLVHGAERLVWCSLPLLLGSPMLLALAYTASLVLALLTSLLMNFLLFELLPVDVYRRVVALRTSVLSGSSVLGMAGAVVLLALVERPLSYVYAYGVALAVGLFTTLVIALAPLPDRLSPRPRLQPDGQVEAEMTSLFLFLALLLAASNLMAVVWPAYLIQVLGAPDHLAAGVSAVMSMTSVVASTIWSRRPFRDYRLAIAMYLPVPLLVAFTSEPELHLLIAVLASIALTGANFLASFTYARYASLVGATRSTLLLVSASSLGQLLASSIALALGGYVEALISAWALAGLCAIVAFTMVGEVAVVPERYVRAYSRIVHRVAAASYRLTVRTTAETSLVLAELVVVAASLALLYLVWATIAGILGVSPPPIIVLNNTS